MHETEISKSNHSVKVMKLCRFINSFDGDIIILITPLHPIHPIVLIAGCFSIVVWKYVEVVLILYAKLFLQR